MDNAPRIPELTTDHPVISLDKIQFLERTARIQAYHFSLLLFSERLNEFVMSCRKIYEIPDGGIKGHEEALTHFKKLSREWRANGLLRKNKKTEDLSRTILIRVMEYLKDNTNFYARSFQNQRFYYELLYDYIVYNDPFVTLRILFEKNPDRFRSYQRSEPDYQFAIPEPSKTFGRDCFHLDVSIYAETSKKEIHKLIDDVWKTISAYQQKLPEPLAIQRITNPQKLIVKWRVYQLYKQGLNTKQIAWRLKKGEVNVRKIISEVKREIKTMEKMTLPQE